MGVIQWEDVKKSDGLFSGLQATVVWEGVGFMVTNVKSPDGSLFSADDAMDYLMNKHPDATEIILRDPNALPKTEWSRHPWKVEGSSNPWL